MRLTQHCPRCSDYFLVPSDSPAAAVLDQMAEAGPWSVLGDGETLEDQVFTALRTKESVNCPHCGASVALGEESFGRFTQELLTQW
jgi:endogenous inhibitor of DNA gyrase (YacG/DUF329 family)